VALPLPAAMIIVIILAQRTADHSIAESSHENKTKQTKPQELSGIKVS
jgi:hypothetical protein